MSKKLVRGDFKSGRVQDPTAKVGSRHEKSIKKYVKEFMDRAVQKKVAKDKERAERNAQKEQEQAVNGKVAVKTDTPDTPQLDSNEAKEESDDEMIPFSGDEDNGDDGTTPPSASSNSELKRKRENEGDDGSPKRTRTEDTPPAPPPPPPPPMEDMPANTPEQGAQSTEGAVLPERAKLGEELGKAVGYLSPMQLATPPTTTNGSCEHDSNGKDGSSHSFEGLESSKRAAVITTGGES